MLLKGSGRDQGESLVLGYFFLSCYWGFLTLNGFNSDIGFMYTLADCFNYEI